MNEIEKLRNCKRTENGDISYSSTGNNLMDILFMAPYFENNLDAVHIGSSPKEQLFSMFVRDPRYGLGRRDLGRKLMELSGVCAPDIVKAGRYDDLFWASNVEEAIRYWVLRASTGDQLAKKWLPRLTGKNKAYAKAICKMMGLSEKEYRRIIKCENTVEYKLSYTEKVPQNPLQKVFGQETCSHPLVNTIEFEKVPSQAMIKYFHAFSTREDTKQRFSEYMDKVKSGEKKLNVSTTNVYDIYRNRDSIDADVFFDKLEKIGINCIPIVDTSCSMWWDDALGKALSIGHYLSKCSSYCNGWVIPFSSRPHLMKIGGKTYEEEIQSMYTGDVSNTDLGKVMELLKELEEYPEYLVILSDMEFDLGSSMRKDSLMKLWKEKGYTTKIIWWNFNGRNKTVPETDDMGNIFLSGYSPALLKYFEAGFDGNKFLDKLLEEYKNKIS